MSEPNFIEAAKRLAADEYIANDGEVAGVHTLVRDAECFVKALTDPTSADAEWLESTLKPLGWLRWSNSMWKHPNRSFFISPGSIYCNDASHPLLINPTRGQVAAAMLMFAMGGE